VYNILLFSGEPLKIVHSVYTGNVTKLNKIGSFIFPTKK